MVKLSCQCLHKFEPQCALRHDPFEIGLMIENQSFKLNLMGSNLGVHFAFKGSFLNAYQHIGLSSTEAYTEAFNADLLKMHKAFHPRESEKNVVLPEL